MFLTLTDFPHFWSNVFRKFQNEGLASLLREIKGHNRVNWRKNNTKLMFKHSFTVSI